jgi:hypothetical protein
MSKPTNKRAGTDPARKMHEYYVKIPEPSYNNAHLAIIKWLMERQEPAHSVGIPIVETSCFTYSATYPRVFLGPSEAEDRVDFEKMASATERDCVGLTGYRGLTPKGMWMPTNSTGDPDPRGYEPCARSTVGT